jgi:carboxymethylenebutenolidase
MEPTKEPMPREAIDAYNLYIHGEIDRRGFFDRVRKVAISTAAAAAIVDQLMPNYAAAQQVSPTDARLKTSRETVPSPAGNGTIKGYLARPTSAGNNKLPAILVVHENRGLNPHIEDIARRLALADFLAFAPDALAALGGYPGTEDEARQLFPKLDQKKTQEDFLAAAAFLGKHPDCTGKIGVVGFCWGGGVANMLATRLPGLAAAVPFYGSQPPPEDVAKIKAPLLIHYAGNDQRINAGWPGYEAALKAARVPYTTYTYPGTEHGFNNDTTPRYDEAAAKLAWQRTIAFFNKHLR